MRRANLLPLLAILIAGRAVSAAGPADEGMWTLDNFPVQAVAEKYDVTLDAEWLRRAQLTTARLEGGCTGSFVSPDGLVLTNNHCVWSCVRENSDASRNLSDEGFLAGSRDEEIRCAREQVSVLMEMEDVTEAIRAATEGLDESEANEARSRELSGLEASCEEASGGQLSCESVSLYQGGQYFLYKYKRYDDVRLVFAPELDIAAFGGDPDNFNFPRYCLDMSFLRVYENGAPARTPEFLEWRAAGPLVKEPVFVTGHPGSTDRQMTMAELTHLKQVEIPLWLLRYTELRGRLLQWGRTGGEAERVVQQRVLGIENGIKVRRNQLFALLDDERIAVKAEEERRLRDAVEADPALHRAYGDGWDQVESALQSYRSFYREFLFLEQAAGFYGELFAFARALVRATAEREMPNEDRLPGYTDSALRGLEQRLLADVPVNDEYQELGLSFSLEKMREWLGPDHPQVKAVLGSESPEAMARRLVSETRVDEASFRRALWEGGRAAVEASDDPLIRLARAVDRPARELRARYENEVVAPRTEGSEKIAAARFRVLGTNSYPDATFTLRVTYGAVDGWLENGSEVDPFTRIGTAFARATGERPFRLPDSWLEARDRLGADTPFNFVATTDITGGNSGSPVIDASGRLVGLAFDGNIHSIAGDYWFNPENNRTVAVHPAAMLEALERVYGASALLDELVLAE